MKSQSIFLECFIVVGGALLLIALPLLLWAVISHAIVWIWELLAILVAL